MRKNFGAETWLYPMPVFIIGTYNEDGTANAMNAAWGGTANTHKIAICVDKGHKTTENFKQRKAFTVSIADKANLVEIICCTENTDVAFISTVNRALVVNTSQISEKTTKNSAGVQVQTLKKNQYVKAVKTAEEAQFANISKYKTKNIPAAGSFLKEEDIAQQLTL